jgi:hypothetical protein
MSNDPVVIFLLVIGGFFVALELYLGYCTFEEWGQRKLKLFKLGVNLIRKGESKVVRDIGWATLRLVLWESKNDDKCSTDKEKE